MRYLKFKGLLLVIGSLLLTNSYGQQLPVYSQYMMNMFLINPAIAGADGYTSINITAREQWLGIPDSPSTQAASFQTRLLKKSYISRSKSIKKNRAKPSKSGKVGLGAHLFTDKNGMIRRTGAQFTYAYHILFRESQLSFGLSAVCYQMNVDEDGFFDVTDPNDPLLLNYDRTVIIPDMNFGVFYKTKEYYLGFSTVNLFESVFKINKSAENNYKLLRYYYLTGGYGIVLTKDLSLIPSALLKSPDNLLTFQMDLSAKFIYKESYWGGLSYRTSDVMIIFAGIRIENFHFGYAFDYTFNAVQTHTFGSHEFMFAVKFGSNARRYRWLSRY